MTTTVDATMTNETTKTTTTIQTITAAQIADLHSEAVAAGDEAMARIARKALVTLDTCHPGDEPADSDALRECVAAIQAAEAMAE